MQKKYAVIAAVGGYLPEDVLTNADIEKMVDTSDEWIISRVGIKERRILKDPGKGSSYLGIRAAEDLFARHSNVKKEEIDLVMVSTCTPDHGFPSTASIIADAIGIPVGVPCFDFQAACPGFIFGLQIARGMIESGVYRKILLIATEKMSAFINPKDRSTLPLFGDGSGCVVLEATEEPLGIMDASIHNDNRDNAHHLILKAGGSLRPASHQTVEEGMHYVYQEGQAVFKSAVSQMGDSVAEIMERNHLTREDVTWVVPHQANMRIITATAKRVSLDMEKVMLTIEKYGNTSSATIPICLWEYEKRLKKGDTLILTSFGAGFTYGSVYLKWGYDCKE